MQRNRTVDRPEWSEPLFPMLDIKLLVEQPPPERHRLAGQVGCDLVDHAVSLNAGVDANLPAFRLARKSTKPVEGAHGPQSAGRQIFQPILSARMRLRPVRLTVVADKIVSQP